MLCVLVELVGAAGVVGAGVELGLAGGVECILNALVVEAKGEIEEGG